MDEPLNPADALAITRDARQRLAQTPTPRWYAPLYGVGCGAMVAALALPSPWMTIVNSFALTCLVLMYVIESRRSGVRLNGFRRGATLPVALTLVAVLLGAMLLSAHFREIDGYRWVPLAAGLAIAVLAGIASHLWERAWRREMAGGK